MGDMRTDPGHYYPGGRVKAKSGTAPQELIVQWSDVQGKPQIAPLPDRYREDDMKGKINEIASKFATVVFAALIGWTAVADITVQKKRKDQIYNDDQVVVDVTISGGGGGGVDTNAVREIVRPMIGDATNGLRRVDDFRVYDDDGEPTEEEIIRGEFVDAHWMIDVSYAVSAGSADADGEGRIISERYAPKDGPTLNDANFTGDTLFDSDSTVVFFDGFSLSGIVKVNEYSNGDRHGISFDSDEEGEEGLVAVSSVLMPDNSPVMTEKRVGLFVTNNVPTGEWSFSPEGTYSLERMDFEGAGFVLWTLYYEDEGEDIITPFGFEPERLYFPDAGVTATRPVRNALGLAMERDISASNPAFTNAVLQTVVSGLATNITAEVYIAATNAMANLGLDPGLIPQGGTIGTVGGLLVALAAAVALLRKKTALLKSDGTAEEGFTENLLSQDAAKEAIDARIKTNAESATEPTNAVTLNDNAPKTVTVATATADSLAVTFGTARNGGLRICELYILNGTANTDLTFDAETVSFVATGDSFPACEAGINYFVFAEVAANLWKVTRETLKSITTPTPVAAA